MTAREQRELLEQEFHSFRNRAYVLYAGLDPEDMRLTPPSGGWSVLQAIDHLNMTANFFVPPLKKALEASRQLPAHDEMQPYQLGMLERTLLWFLEPPYRFRAKTPTSFDPLGKLDPSQVKMQFDYLHDQVRELIPLAHSLPIDRVKIESPFEKRVKYSAWGALCIIPAHVRRHLWQAERIKEALQSQRPVAKRA